MVIILTSPRIKITFRKPKNFQPVPSKKVPARAERFARRMVQAGGSILCKKGLPHLSMSSLAQRGVKSIEIPRAAIEIHGQEYVKRLLKDIILIALTAHNIPQALLDANLGPQVILEGHGTDITDIPPARQEPVKPQPKAAAVKKAPAPKPPAKAAAPKEKTKIEQNKAAMKYEMPIEQFVGFGIAGAAAFIGIVVNLPPMLGIAGAIFLITGILHTIVRRNFKNNMQGKGILYINDEVFSSEQQEEIVAALKEIKMGRGIKTRIKSDGQWTGTWVIRNKKQEEAIKRILTQHSLETHILTRVRVDTYGKREVVFYTGKEKEFSAFLGRHPQIDLLKLRGLGI